MKKTIKLRDMTKKQYLEWFNEVCGGEKIQCEQCPFMFIACEAYSAVSPMWYDHKDLYSDKFLDQTIEIEVSDLLTEEEKACLKQLIKLSAFEVKAIEFVISSDFVCVEFINNRGSEQNDCFHFQKSLFKGIEQIKQYTFEDLGLEDK